MGHKPRTTVKMPVNSRITCAQSLWLSEDGDPSGVWVSSLLQIDRKYP